MGVTIKQVLRIRGAFLDRLYDRLDVVIKN